jgi:hypothetical protein
MEETGGILSFALGEGLLLFGIYFIIENADKPWINTSLFTVYFILPPGFISFSLLGLGLYFVSKSTRNQRPQ